FADVVAANNGKEKGIDEIIKYFGFSLDETMSFGDGGNDMSMLRHAAIGVAMGNAGKRVKQAADYVTTSVDDNGIMNALKYFNII
ncbi:putative bifunctional phosphatase/peptidyl-prolyl cis-trans isomerase, partial [termite gut metagenome]